ncbi:hypothetical protein N7478_010631 [Penicillium angulare]|uniref:uncharacterized protein n=1 Tax=Penicillium angulare TaxID=116970 RepID=UPI00254041A4|nr:uncharacterized protein N7478_010631 [Penicillium angulare]KAJ5267823.1 hypothetical protein N7478_010631 [Penicillium angulare]
MYSKAKTAKTLCFGDKSITVKKDELLNSIRPTVYRLELEEPRHGLPRMVIVKQEKPEQEYEFEQEKNAYEKLQDLQGTLIPTLFGQGYFNGRPALILSEIEGITLRDLAKFQSRISEKILEICLEEAFEKLNNYGAEYCDLNLGNFLFCNNGQIVVVDLEDVEFPDRLHSQERKVNTGSVRHLMSRFRDVKYPQRPPSPVNWASCTGDGDDKSSLEAPEPYNSIMGLVNRERPTVLL